ncbi:MAG: entericidin A/B family lipoprotein [Pseudomonadota bacterium]
MIRIFLLLGVVLGLAACATVDGFGQDVSSAGEALSQTAEELDEDDE